MRSLARLIVVIAFVAGIVCAGTAPAVETAAATTSAATAIDGASSGFKSQPAPEKPVYVGPGPALSGPTLISALVPSPALATWRLPSRPAAASSPVLRASRLSPHLRSIPLLI